MAKPNIHTHRQKCIFMTFFFKERGDVCLPKLKFVGNRDGVLGNPKNWNWTGKTGTKWILHIRLKQLVCSVVVSSGCTIQTLEFFVLDNQARKMCYPFYCLHRLESAPLYRTLYVVQIFPSHSGELQNGSTARTRGKLAETQFLPDPLDEIPLHCYNMQRHGNNTVRLESFIYGLRPRSRVKIIKKNYNVTIRGHNGPHSSDMQLQLKSPQLGRMGKDILNVWASLTYRTLLSGSD
jgi:hypothetical protein